MPHSFTNIDLARLEEEWLLQPGLYDKYAARLADAKLDLAEAEAELEVTKVTVARNARRNPSKFGIDKVTEPAIKEAIPLSAKYQAAVAKVNEVKHKVDVLTAVINTLEHRKRTLENLVTLHGQLYFAKPRVKDEYNKSVSLADRKASRPKGLRRKKSAKDKAK